MGMGWEHRYGADPSWHLTLSRILGLVGYSADGGPVQDLGPHVLDREVPV